MKKEKLYEAIGEIDDNYINDAHLTTKKKKSRPAWIKWGAMAACLCLVVALFPLINNMKRTEQPNEPSVSEAPVHFYLDGNLYCFHGDITKNCPKAMNVSVKSKILVMPSQVMTLREMQTARFT